MIIKSYKNLLTIIFFVLLTFVSTFIMAAECELTIQNFQVDNNLYSFDIFISRDTTWNENTALGSAMGMHSTLVFNLNQSAFSQPDWFDSGAPIDSINALFMGENKLSLELFESGEPVPIEPSKLVTICMTITDFSATAELSWDETNSILFKSNNAGQVDVEYFGSDNTSLPVNEDKYNFENNKVNFDCFPNPIIEKNYLELKFNIPTEENVKISIYNIQGRKIKTLFNKKTKGSKNITWNLTNQNLKPISNGVYFIKLGTNNKLRETKKVVILR